MHYLMLVTLTYLDGDTSLNARRQAEELLQQDDSFCGEGGRFGCPVCDWFVIGGRWSGHLKKALLGDAYKAAFEREFPQMAQEWFSSDLVNTHRERLDQLWQQFGGSGPSPLTRNTYDSIGYDDDAMLVDQALYDHFLAQYEGHFVRQGDQDHWTFADLDNEEVSADFIGRKWLVVIDYHN